jgi:GNAT superfamily N-acetyltransferase
MPSRHPELSLDSVRTLSVRDRKSKVSLQDFAKEVRPGMTVGELLAALPDVLAGRDLRTLVARLEESIRREAEWIFMLGGHVIKTGTAPVIVPMIRDGWISCVAMNGSASVHDVEIALFGKTSEVVEENLADGSFGMAQETAEFLNQSAVHAHERGEGLGEALGEALLRADAPFRGQSLLAASAEAGIPATVHVALGTDIVHQHPSARGDAIGDATLRDFRILAARIAELSGGVVLNVGSAVLMPEIFLKALTVARNLGHRVEEFAAADFDMIRQYRPVTNVVARPTQGKGWGAHFTGHHEILVPLLSACLQERLGGFRSPA